MDLKAIEQEILKDPILSKLSNLAKEKDISLFLVGGYIRDLFLETPHHAYRPGPNRAGAGQAGKDYDFTLPKEAFSFISSMEEALDLRFFKVGKEEMDTLTYRIIKEDMSMDLTFLQGNGIDEDLQRRDFTINAFAFSLREQTCHWVEGALEDIEKRVIRTVSNHSIDQDPLRMLRALRYLCTLDGFTLDPALKEEISQKRELTCKLPGERIKMELDHMFLSPQPAVGMKSLHESGLLLTLLPELRGLEKLGQNEHHHLNVLSHILLMVEKISWADEWITLHGKKIPFTREDWLSLYYAGLFHDVGKQDTYSKDEKGKVHFYYHESFSSQTAERIMERLRFSNAMRNRILSLIQNHMRILNLSRETKETALKRLVHQMGEETPLLVLLTLADKEASRGILSIQVDEVVEDHCLRILKLFEEKEIVHPPSLITGHDVMDLGYPSGPKVGQILNFIRGKQVEGEIKTREEALAILRERVGSQEKRLNE
jgi:tRNA nucleotidyltransferase/poly(A) polymerase